MEELRSTEILDKEIQTDARKKAELILANADGECSKILTAVDGRVDAAKKEMEETFKNRESLFKKNSDASIPLEKERFYVSYIGTSVISAFSDYLQLLSGDKRVELIFNSLAKKQKYISGKKITAFVYGSDSELIKTKLKKSLGKNLISCTTTKYEKIGYQSVSELTVREGIIMEAQDHSFKCRLTIEELVAEILDKYRYELASTLFGGRLPA